jgi:hypothetical protein
MAKVKEVNVATGEVIERDMTIDELAMQAEFKAEIMAKEAEQEAKATQKAALLDRLGINDKEAKLLLA